MNISIKNKNEIEKLRNAGQLAADVLNMITEYVKPGISTGELDNICGVSSNIMMGQEVPVGTGFVDLLFDEEAYMDRVNIPTMEEEEIKIDEDRYKEEYCSYKNLDFNINIDDIDEDFIDDDLPDAF